MIQLCKSLGKQCWNFVANGILRYIDSENQLDFQNFFFSLSLYEIALF